MTGVAQWRQRRLYQEIGERLRDLRLDRGLSLSDVEVKSGGQWKHMTVMSYELANRRPMVHILIGLAEFYRVPVKVLIPGAEDGDVPLAVPLGITHSVRQVKAASVALGATCEALEAAIEAAVRDGGPHDTEPVKAGEGDG